MWQGNVLLTQPMNEYLLKSEDAPRKQKVEISDIHSSGKQNFTSPQSVVRLGTGRRGGYDQNKANPPKPGGKAQTIPQKCKFCSQPNSRKR